MQADDKCTPEEKQQSVSSSDNSRLSVPDGWPFRKAKDLIDTQKDVKLDLDITLDLDPFAEEYNMNHKRRGVALVLNHVNFDSMSARKGSIKDSLDLKASLGRLGFDVRIYTDPTVKTITTILQTTAAEDHTDADCLIVVAMSHGESGLLHSTDSLYPVDMLWVPFTGDRCTSLAGKPKLFFIQACRGTRLDRGVRIIHETDSKRTTYSIPAYADIMVAYSTYDGIRDKSNSQTRICQVENCSGYQKTRCRTNAENITTFG
ncbi:caspase-1-like isoform X2 [Linepithema humile]|uniref:caspase-1-like isoform X2 n=1 Tax=Linepithema humile TaxID=83485 RepID=UPI00351E5890